MDSTTYTAFSEANLLATGELRETLRAVKAFLEDKPTANVLIFNDGTGEQVDFDFSGTILDVLSRTEATKPKNGPGRPSLGIVSREVSLLPRHWEWLEKQQHNVSAAIRRLVDDAIRNEPASAKARRAVEAADREMWTLAGNLPGCEEASRSLYARDFDRFDSLIETWPEDVRRHLSVLAKRAS